MPAYHGMLHDPSSTPEELSENLEGAVGYQSDSFSDQSSQYNAAVPNHIHQPLPTTMNLDEHTFQDSENNNVDENSNDHQYNQYAGYHLQFQDQSFMLDHDVYNLQAAQEQAVRERVYQRFHNSVDQPDRAPIDVPESNFVRHSYQGSSRRRNLSEDLSLTTHSHTLPSLPTRNSNIDINSHQNLRWLPVLPRRQHQPSPEEIRNQAEALLYNFTIEEFRSQNIDPPPLPIHLDLHNPTWARAGKDLRMLADAFSKSNEREVVRRKAYDINLSSITMNNFFRLCSELFEGEGGITQERIVVLFTFISDVAIQHVRLKAEQFIQRLMCWSLRFIYERICEWVQRAGGWGVVLNNGASFLFKSTMTVLASLGIVALGVYILKTIKEL